MRPDEDMIREATIATTGKGRALMDDRIERYRIACVLAKGPSPERSQYWQEKAARLASEIRQMTPQKSAPGVGREQCA